MHPFRRPIAWLRAHPFTADVMLAVAVTALTLPSLWSTPSDAGDTNFRDPDVLGVVLLVLSSTPIAWRRRSPFATLVVVGTAAVIYEALGYPTQLSTVGVLVALYTAAAHLDRRRSLQAATFTAVGLAIVLLTARWEVNLASIVSNIVIFATVWLIGDNLQTRRANVAALLERAERAEQTRAAEAQRAVAEERTRIARELHDVVAHSMSVMLVQTGAARRVLGTDPAQATAALEAVETTGRDAMKEMRRLLGVLREDSAPAALAPLPSLDGLDALVAQFTEAGLHVTLDVVGTDRPLSAGIELSAYRIVQEALTNALKHAGPGVSVVVTVHVADDDLEVLVVDDGRGAAVLANGNGGGHGVLGMRERADVCGGELVAGPRAGGGFEVRARLPVSEGAEGLTIRAMVVDDQALVRAGFRMILDAEPDLDVVGEAEDGLQAVEVAERARPDVILMDIRMPRLDGVEATARITTRPDPPRVLILTTFDLDEYVFAALRAGASGFLLKDTPAEDLVDAVRVVAAGDALLAPSITRRVIEEFAAQAPASPSTTADLERLTEREHEVLVHMARGLSNGEIAEALYLGETTVKTHVGRILMKLQLRDRVQAVVLAYESGLVQPGR